MFIGRDKELTSLCELLKNPGKHAAIYGVRRIGKTTLAQKAAIDSGHIFISYECEKTSLEENVRSLTSLLEENGLLPGGIEFQSIDSLFKFINGLNKRIVILIDEFPYLYAENSKNVVDSKFQKIIDNYSSNLNIIVSGSHIGMMKTLFEESNPAYGRFDLIIHLEEFDYYDASTFYKNLSSYDKAAFYSVFGGSPFVLSQLDFSKSLEENIKNTFLNQSSSLYMFISEGFTTDASFKDASKNVFKALGNRKLRYREIEELMHVERNGLVSKYLKNLMEMELVDKISPINKTDDVKKARYRIRNNALKFFYAYVFGKGNILSLVGEDIFFERYIKESLTTFVSYRFEDIAKSFLSRLAKKGMLNDVLNIGSYYYDDPINKKNGEFDIALETTNGIVLFEAKYYKKPLPTKEINKELSQIKEIKELHIADCGFISISGYEETNQKVRYCFDGDDLYFVK